MQERTRLEYRIHREKRAVANSARGVKTFRRAVPGRASVFVSCGAIPECARVSSLELSLLELSMFYVRYEVRATRVQRPECRDQSERLQRDPMRMTARCWLGCSVAERTGYSC